MSKIEYNKLVGVFDEKGDNRLDIGTDAMKNLVPADHNSWATRLRIMKLNNIDIKELADLKSLTNQVIKQFLGDSESSVLSDGDVVGIFSENGEYRLDIGDDAVKKNISVNQESNTTQLKIRSLENSSSEQICHGDLVGIFSKDGKYRLDIGVRATQKNVPANHESPTTKFQIKHI